MAFIFSKVARRRMNARPRDFIEPALQQRRVAGLAVLMHQMTTLL